MDIINQFMQDVTKVEIIIDRFHIEDALKILDSVGASGYTIIENTMGKGDRGLSCDDFNCDFSSSYILTVCTNENQLNNLVDKIQPLLKKVGGVCLVANAKWISH